MLLVVGWLLFSVCCFFLLAVLVVCDLVFCVFGVWRCVFVVRCSLLVVSCLCFVV